MTTPMSGTDELRAALEALRADYLAKHEQSVIDAAEFGPKAGAQGRWKARAEGVEEALFLLATTGPSTEPAASEPYQDVATIPAIEAEAVAAERERIVAAVGELWTRLHAPTPDDVVTAVLAIVRGEK